MSFGMASIRTDDSRFKSTEFIHRQAFESQAEFIERVGHEVAEMYTSQASERRVITITLHMEGS